MNQLNQLKKKPVNSSSSKDRKTKVWIQILNGSFFTKDMFFKNINFILYLTFLLLLYIANGYLAEDNVRDIAKLEKEVNELHAEYITTKSELMYTSKYSEVVRMVNEKNLGLIETHRPPLKIEENMQVVQNYKSETE
ncbi:MAG: hypothetical protein D6707_09105 [Bacteroidetes bacterium]|nr:MAG: hypothetical protein D6707_09105 [Bacteroidota bacterium]